MNADEICDGSLILSSFFEMVFMPIGKLTRILAMTSLLEAHFSILFGCLMLLAWRNNFENNNMTMHKSLRIIAQRNSCPFKEGAKKELSKLKKYDNQLMELILKFKLSICNVDEFMQAKPNVTYVLDIISEFANEMEKWILKKKGSFSDHLEAAVMSSAKWIRLTCERLSLHGCKRVLNCVGLGMREKPEAMMLEKKVRDLVIRTNIKWIDWVVAKYFHFENKLRQLNSSNDEDRQIFDCEQRIFEEMKQKKDRLTSIAKARFTLTQGEEEELNDRLRMVWTQTDQNGEYINTFVMDHIFDEIGTTHFTLVCEKFLLLFATAIRETGHRMLVSWVSHRSVTLAVVDHAEDLKAAQSRLNGNKNRPSGWLHTNVCGVQLLKMICKRILFGLAQNDEIDPS